MRLRTLFAMVLGVVLVAVFLPPAETQQRGDLYGARALQSLEQAFKTTGVLTFPNYAAAPVTCNAANYGVYYYDTTTNQALVCGSAGWLSAGFSVGTLNYIPKFTATGLTDSVVIDNGTSVTVKNERFTVEDGASGFRFNVQTASDQTWIRPDGTVTGGTWEFNDMPADGTSGYQVGVSGTAPLMNGSDTFRALYFSITNPNHTGASNVFNLIEVGSITGDANATENAVYIGDGWDNGINFSAASIIQYTTTLTITEPTPAASTGDMQLTLRDMAAAGSADLMEWAVRPPALNGSDTVSAFKITLTNLDHTGASNVVNGLEMAGITADADATENAVYIGDGWDYDIYIAGQGVIAADDAGGDLTVQAADVMAIRSGSEDVFSARIGLPSSDMLQVLSSGMTMHNNQIAIDIGNGSLTAAVMDGSDTQTVLMIDIVNADHTGTGNTLNAISIGSITGDAEATENAIYMDAGWDFAVDSSALATAFWNIGNNYGGFRCGTAGAVNCLIVDGDANNLATFVLNGPSITASNAERSAFESRPTIGTMNGNDAAVAVLVDITNNGDHTGTPNTVDGIRMRISATDADASENAIVIEGGWDNDLVFGGTAHASLDASAANGSVVFCTNCDPASTPCTTGGASSGAFAFRVNGQWDCPW